MWVKDTCYHNKRIINPEIGNIFIFIPNILGRTLFQFTKNDKKFSKLVLELLDIEPELINLKTIGADMVEAIAKGLKRVIPNIKVLYCVKHLKQREEIKLDSLIEKVTASAAEKNSSQSRDLERHTRRTKGSYL